MGKYIDADRLRAAIEEKYRTEIQPWLSGVSPKSVIYEYVLPLIDYLKQEQTDMGEVSDGYHTFNELYYYRMLYNAAFFNELAHKRDNGHWDVDYDVHKSKKHSDGEDCFGGGWFIVMANLPTGQVSNHYELKDWDLFQVPEKEFADEWDGHTPQEAAERLHKYLQQEQPDFPPINPDDAMKKLDEKIALVKERGTWKGVDVDKFMDEVRGREPVCEELEKELDEFLKDHVFGKLINRNAGLALARHFAEWQSKQDKETIELAEDHAMLAGMMKMKEQMMKEAVCYIAQADITATGNIKIPFIRIGYTALSRYGIIVGDKVRIIIIKED